MDAVLTTTELIEMVNMRRISRTEIVPQDFDQPYSRVTGAGVMFAASGGVAEAALRMAVEKLTGEPLVEHLYFENVVGLEGFKEARIEAAGRTVSVAVINGLGNAEPVIKRILSGEDLGYDFIEIMACPGGCIGGAGHPVPERAGEMQERLALIKSVDSQSEFRKSQENPDILRLYDEFYGEPNSELAHRLLHTAYAPYPTPVPLHH